MEQSEQAGGKIWITISSLYIVLLTLFVALSAHTKYDNRKVKAAQLSLHETFVSDEKHTFKSGTQSNITEQIQSAFRSIKSVALDYGIPQNTQIGESLTISIPIKSLFDENNRISENGSEYLKTISIILKSSNADGLTLNASIVTDYKNSSDNYVKQSAAIIDELFKAGINPARLKASIVNYGNIGFAVLTFGISQ